MAKVRAGEQLDRRRARPPGHDEARERRAPHGRQHDRPGDRHRAPEGRVPERRRRALPEPVRERAARARRAPRRDASCPRPPCSAGRRGTFVWVVKADETGRDAAGDARRHRRARRVGRRGLARRASGSSSTGAEGSVPARRSRCRQRAPGQGRVVNVVRRPSSSGRSRRTLLMVAILLAGVARLPAPARLRAAAGRLPDDPGRDVLPGRQPGRHGVVGHGAARAPVRPDAGPRADDVDELGRQLGRHAAVRARASSLDVAEQEVQAAINAAFTYLPQRPADPADLQQGEPADAPILTLALSSATLPLPQRRGPRRHAARAEDRRGVRRRARLGERRPAAGGPHPREPDRARRLRAHARGRAAPPSPRRTSTARRAASTARRARTRSARTTSSMSSADYRPVVIAVPERRARPARATSPTVVDDAENVRQAAWMNDTPAVILNVQRQPGANVIEVVDRITALLPQLKRTLPAGVDVSVLTDRTTTIRASVEDVQFELFLSVVLVVLVIFLFLRSVAGTVIPAVAVPLSLVGTFGVMYLLGFSLNNLSLMALTIATGLRRRRRDRDDRERRALRRAGPLAARGGARGRAADRLHDPVAHRLARRGADPAPLHGRRRRAALPRVRDHARHHDPHLGRRLAHADAHDVRAAPPAHAAGAAGPLLLARRSACSSGRSTPTGARSAGSSAHERATLLVVGRRARPHDPRSTSSSRRASSRAGHRARSSASRRRRSRSRSPAMAERQRRSPA